MPPKYEKISIHNYSINNVKAFQSYLANNDFTPLFRSNRKRNYIENLKQSLKSYLILVVIAVVHVVNALMLT